MRNLQNNLTLSDRPITVQQEIRILQSITHEEVQTCIARLIENEPSLITYGDDRNLHSLEEFRDMLKTAAHPNQKPVAPART